jgi:hypothetical protein
MILLKPRTNLVMAEMARWAHQLQAKTPQRRSRIGIGVRVTEVQSRSHFVLGKHFGLFVKVLSLREFRFYFLKSSAVTTSRIRGSLLLSK